MKNRSLWRLTLTATALAVCTFCNNATAATIAVQSTGTAPFATFNVGTATNAQFLAGPNVGAPISTATITNPGFADIASISFSGGTPLSGVYAGSVDGIVKSPFALGTFVGPGGSASCNPSCPEYFAAQPGGMVTITFNSLQTSLDLLWGTVDVPSNWNLLVTSAGDTISGAVINSLLGNPPTGTVNSAVEITGLSPFLAVTFSDNTAHNPAFEFDIGAPVTTIGGSGGATPLPAALPLFATGIGGLGLLGWRRKRKAQAVA
jgi:hypothetical protein